MPTDTSTIFREELVAGERILWSGQPKQGFMLRPSDAFMIPYSLLWVVFAIVMGSIIVVEGAPMIFTTIGVLFILAGLYMMIGRFFIDAKQRERTYYALTNERVVIISGVFVRNVRTLNLKMLSDINISVKNDGRGTITFGPSHAIGLWFSGLTLPGAGKYNAPVFEMIENARQVYELLREAQREM